MNPEYDHFISFPSISYGSTVKPHEFGPVERTPATYLHHLMFISLNWSLTAFLARWISMFSWHQRKVVPTSKSYLYSLFEGFWPEWNKAISSRKLWFLRVLKGFPIHKCHRKIKTNPSSETVLPWHLRHLQITKVQIHGNWWHTL